MGGSTSYYRYFLGEILLILETYHLIQGIKPLVLGEGPPSAFHYYDGMDSVRGKLNTNFATIADFIETVEVGVEDFSALLFGKGVVSGLDYTFDSLTLSINDGQALIGRVIPVSGKNIILPANSVTYIYVDQSGEISTQEPDIEYFIWGKVSTNDTEIVDVDLTPRGSETIIPAILRIIDGNTSANITDISMKTDIEIVHSTKVAVQGYISAQITSEHKEWCNVYPIYPELWTPTSFYVCVEIDPQYQEWYYYYFEGTPQPGYEYLPTDIQISWQRTGLIMGDI